MMGKKFIDITLASGVIVPEKIPDLIAAVPVPAGGTEGIILSGRMPVWTFGALIHYFHPRPFVATFDPRLGGGVVVASHTPDVKTGDVVNVDDAEKIDVSFDGEGE